MTQSPGEELANSVSHAVGFVGTLVAGPVLIASAIRHGGVGTIVGASIFVATALLLYLFSTLYHAVRGNRAKRVFQVLDHSAIFLLIAGTYTPFTPASSTARGDGRCCGPSGYWRLSASPSPPPANCTAASPPRRCTSRWGG